MGGRQESMYTICVPFFMPVTRIGEASHPGPVIPMPGDGHCLYHALVWWCHMPALAVRHMLANIPQGLWMHAWPEDPVLSYPTYIAETFDLRVWGGQQQIIVAAHLWQVRIHVHTPFGVELYGEGPPWHLVYASDPVGHYDVLGPDLSVPPNRGPAAPPNTMAPILPPQPPPPHPPCTDASCKVTSPREDCKFGGSYHPPHSFGQSRWES